MCQKSNEIVLDNVSFAYGDNVIFKDFNTVFSRGINVVLGKSGCGKTTLLNIITGVVDYTGKCLSAPPSVVLSEPTLAPVSVENNVRIIFGKNCSEQVDEALKLAHIADKRKQNALMLSDGEKQRVSLARAFACSRSVMLLDEPFSRLDYGVKRQLYDTLTEYLQNKNITALLVTHDVDEALTLADRIYFLSNKPCTISQVAELTELRGERNIYDGQHNEIRKKLQNLLLDSTSES